MNFLGKFLDFFKGKKIKRRNLKAASKDRAYSHWITQGFKTPNAYLPQLETVRARANYLYHNDPFIRGAVDLLVNRMVGAGSIPQARTDNEKFNKQAEDLFKTWAENADVYGQFHFGDIERLLSIIA